MSLERRGLVLLEWLLIYLRQISSGLRPTIILFFFILKGRYRTMMLTQQDTGVKPPDGSMNGKVAKQKGGLGTANIAAANGGVPTEQQPQRCPRCDSVNTKFCYYNNYSLSQPRHFCKNCRRYWTKGGALRNVPVGGGCRKNKRLKHRDPSSCLAALAEMDASGSSNILASIGGCGLPGFGPSTSSLIQDLANEGHRQLAISRLAGMQQAFDKRFLTENEHQGGVSTQDLFALGVGNGAPGTPGLLGPFDPSSFPALSYTRSDSHPMLFHPHHTSHELTPFFDAISATSPMLTPTLDHLSTFTSAATAAPVSHHATANSMGNTGAQQQPTTNSNDTLYNVPPQANDNSLWNVSWPEMHAALAGSAAAAGAMLH
ncbi:hypothetical protein GOP47_0003911 [Adiantum capillus-veneris]|uniref:Dof-type domain-containing protein n=1 Tax=Adiantum capillus-veneris TaxID=13818 RepID=A0A9D4V6V5_ADICA|nr:hypothetical protein GOP47_0003911 [Adiantum capillus-veneris]